jgi:hypothetical protein
MKTTMLKYRCDSIGCPVEITVPANAEMEPEGWLFLAAWVVGGGGSLRDNEHFCPNCRTEKLKALGRAH